MKKFTVPDIVKMKAEGKKIPVLTAYGYAASRVLASAGIPMVLVGDSVGMVEAGYETTLPVTMEEMVYHTRSVARGRGGALLVSDMPFNSYQPSLSEARRNAGRLVKEGGAEAVKVEGGRRTADTIKAITDMDIPVMGHVGLTPQSVHRMGGYKVQGRSKGAADGIIHDALAVQEAGAFSIVLEGIPVQLAKEITDELEIPTIGIGAGPHCDGQVLVLNDMLGMNSDQKMPRYVKQYADIRSIMELAIKEFMKEVEKGIYPSKEHSY